MMLNLISSSAPQRMSAIPMSGHGRRTAPFGLRRGQSPLLVSMPHVGTFVPSSLATRMTDSALEMADTDWHLPLVYDFLEGLDATVLTATHSRLVVDLNRPPDGSSLYPGHDPTRLIPLDTLRKEAVYLGELPDAAEIAERITTVWRPYHHAMATELDRLRNRHRHVVVWDAQSMASEIPQLFSGRLDDLNFGTSDGASSDARLIESVLAPVRRQRKYTWTLNSRYKGGAITYSYGNPEQGVHAIQLGLSRRTHMNESSPFEFRGDSSRQLSSLLRDCLAGAMRWAAEH